MADAQTPTPAQLLAFLHGAGEIDGVSFGDRHPTLPGAFWWRRHLPLLAAQAPAQQAVPVGEVVLFGGDLKEIAWREGKLPPVGAKLYAHPPPRTGQ